MREIMKKAHEITREIVKKYGVKYKDQLIISIRFLVQSMNIKKRLERIIEEKKNNGVTSINLFLKSGSICYGDVDCVGLGKDGLGFQNFILEKYRDTTLMTTFKSVRFIDYNLIEWVE